MMEEDAMQESAEEQLTETVESRSSYTPAENSEDSKFQLTGMYRSWFLDYASYVILERAVPHINDGLKPVQRRILHSMKRLDDGRYNKVANIVGHTMQFHPHGDASIGGALVQLGQNDLLIDCQGNWGNILTGDSAAAPRYIEARLSKFALDTVFNPKITEWTASYDGRNKEPVTLPVKFPLLLAQGVEGIAVGLASKILPHNFNELIDASVACLRGEEFELYPDFQTGGYIDVSKYNDGLRGGNVKVRAKIEKQDNRTLVITEIPYAKTTAQLIDSIIKANQKGKIKIRKVDDNTAGNVEILIHLLPGSSSDKTIDALYAFTDCEVSISPNCCIIRDKKPHFLGVSEILRTSTDRTVELLRQELQIQLDELSDDWHYSSLEKIFFEEKIYRELESRSEKSWEDIVHNIEQALSVYQPRLKREITREDVLRLCEKPVRKISIFDIKKADEHIKGLETDMAEVQNNLDHIVDFAIRYFENIRKKYGKRYERKTEIRSFGGGIDVAKVAEANEKLYINREEGFIGTALKKDEFVSNCSDIDDVIVFFKDGKYKIVKVADKIFVGKNVLYLNVFRKNDKRTVYNCIYRDGKLGAYHIKRFYITGITRDREYDITQGNAGSKIHYFTANPNGEAEVVRVKLRPRPRLKILAFEKDFSEVVIKGRGSMGNVLTKNDISAISLKHKGGSTLGGRQVWFDRDVLRLNYDGRGDYLGEFQADDLVLVITNYGEYCSTTFDLSNHYNNDIKLIEKFNPHKVWSVALFDADQHYHYIKRFQLEPSQKYVGFLGENEQSKLALISGEYFPRFEITFGGADSFRPAQIIDVEEFIGVKSYKAKGKRISTYEVQGIVELEPERFPEEAETTEEETEEAFSDHSPIQQDGSGIEPIVDEDTGQISMF
jgi:topoisomerase-4 subunit A